MIYFVQLTGTLTKPQESTLERRTTSALLQWVFGRELPEEKPERVKELWAVGDHGKPYLKGNPFWFNLSHSGGLVVCAAENCPVGVDVEKKRVFTAKLRDRICTAGELELIKQEPRENDALTQLWTMKESYMKYTGLGFAQGIRSTEFAALGNKPRLKTGDGHFASQELEGAFLTLCTAEKVPLEWMAVPFEKLSISN